MTTGRINQVSALRRQGKCAPPHLPRLPARACCPCGAGGSRRVASSDRHQIAGPACQQHPTTTTPPTTTTHTGARGPPRLLPLPWSVAFALKFAAAQGSRLRLALSQPASCAPLSSLFRTTTPAARSSGVSPPIHRPPACLACRIIWQQRRRAGAHTGTTLRAASPRPSCPAVSWTRLACKTAPSFRVFRVVFMPSSRSLFPW